MKPKIVKTKKEMLGLVDNALEKKGAEKVYYFGDRQVRIRNIPLTKKERDARYYKKHYT